MIDKVCFILSHDNQYIYINELIKSVEKPTMVFKVQEEKKIITTIKRFFIKLILQFEKSTSSQLKSFSYMPPEYSNITPDSLTNTLVINLSDKTFNLNQSNIQLTTTASCNGKEVTSKIEDLIWFSKKQTIKLSTVIAKKEILSYTTCNNNILLTVRFNNLIAVMHDLLYYSIKKCLK